MEEKIPHKKGFFWGWPRYPVGEKDVMKRGITMGVPKAK